MAINNSHKPIGPNVKHDPGRAVGGTYGERRQSTVNYQSMDVNVIRHRDFFERKHEVSELPAANADFKLGRNKISVSHKIVETGKAHAGPRITDDARLAFLDRIIAGPAENRAPSAASSTKNPVKSTFKPHAPTRIK